MSIVAITTTCKKCLVEIRLLRLNYVLGRDKNDIIVVEFLADVEQGSVAGFNLYIPHEIIHYEDLTPSFLNPNNEYHYREKFKILSTEAGQEPKIGLIKLNDLEIIVEKVTLDKSDIDRGSIINIKLSKAINAGEKTAVRIIIDCKKLSKHEFSNIYSFDFRYYSHNDRAEMGIANALHVRELLVAAYLPHKAQIGRASPEAFKRLSWDKEGFNFERLEVFFGKRTKSLFKDFPIKLVVWSKDIFHDDPSTTWIAHHLNCDYMLLKGALSIDHTDESISSHEYELIMFGKESSFKTPAEAEVIRSQRSTNNILFIDAERNEVFIKNNFIESFNGLMYSILHHFISNKGIGGNKETIYNSVWGDVPTDDDQKYSNVVDTAMMRFRQLLNEYNICQVKLRKEGTYGHKKTYVLDPVPKYTLLKKIS